MEISVLKERKHQEIHHRVLVCECHLATGFTRTDTNNSQTHRPSLFLTNLVTSSIVNSAAAMPVISA